MVEMTHTDDSGKVHSQVAPAFYHTYAYVNGKKVGMVKPNKFVAERLQTSPAIGRGVTTKLAPMLVPPKNWTSWDDGGYWYTREEVMRTRQSMEQKAYLKEASDSNALGEVYRGLDILGETCWTINKRVFDIVTNIWNTGEEIADIPPQASEMQYPIEPKNATWDVKARMDWIQECRTMSRNMQNAHSVRCDINYKLEIARAVWLVYLQANLSSLARNYISRIVWISGAAPTLFPLTLIISETISVVDYFYSTKENLSVHED
jgi:DNA-directed RNA polymerase